MFIIHVFFFKPFPFHLTWPIRYLYGRLVFVIFPVVRRGSGVLSPATHAHPGVGRFTDSRFTDSHSTDTLFTDKPFYRQAALPTAGLPTAILPTPFLPTIHFTDRPFYRQPFSIILILPFYRQPYDRQQ
jgi:hypothetical protein